MDRTAPGSGVPTEGPAGLLVSPAGLLVSPAGLFG